jgi:uncharacterized membrane-anchored protein YitT (DUF2179 family)
MPESLSPLLRDWHNFYLLIGGAAARLAGLMFVAISLGSGTVTPKNLHGLRVFVSPTLIHFVYVLVAALVVVIPTATWTRLGILLVLVGLISTGRAIGMVPYMRQQHREHRIDTDDWTWYLIAPAVSYLLFVGTGIGFLLRIGLALDGLAIASILLLIAGIRNAWDFVTWLLLRQSDQS